MQEKILLLTNNGAAVHSRDSGVSVQTQTDLTEIWDSLCYSTAVSVYRLNLRSGVCVQTQTELTEIWDSLGDSGVSD